MPELSETGRSLVWSERSQTMADTINDLAADQQDVDQQQGHVAPCIVHP